MLIDAPPKVNPHSELVLAGTASIEVGTRQCSRLHGSGGPCNASFTWSVIGGGVDLTVVATGPHLRFAPTLKLRSFGLADVSYTFQLSVRDTLTGALGTARATVAKNLPPYNGSLLVTPADGWFGDPFTLLASGFIDDHEDLPLAFSFAVCQADTCAFPDVSLTFP